MPIPVIAGGITWAGIGSALMTVLVYPIVAALAISLFFWLLSFAMRLLGLRSLNRTAEREATSMAIQGVRDSIRPGKP